MEIPLRISVSLCTIISSVGSLIGIRPLGKTDHTYSRDSCIVYNHRRLLIIGKI
ncbi:hypothetical protein PL9631_1060333 [Planktothrix paucivesiculata PCC 9631]|uniref:Uncharacterized protein n=1 Tax=Planktothrix paucivesiculata PCC 9631 TaxID=671071 RepID=A0A7Z9DVP2_9CYAN|nr:hypothetical protein PL9631_1060333 [Planktothrix paucivesiculata PCC 9631]